MITEMPVIKYTGVGQVFGEFLGNYGNLCNLPGTTLSTSEKTLTQGD